MKSKIFKQHEFESVINSSKTQFREIIKPHPRGECVGRIAFTRRQKTLRAFDFECGLSIIPRFQIGEKIYLKEPFFKLSNIVWHKTDIANYLWQPAITMPESKARFFVEITEIGVERLGDISDEDCIKCGIYKRKAFVPAINDWALLYHFDTEIERKEMRGYCSPREAYYDTLQKGALKSNLYVWIYDFKLTNN